VTEEGVVKIIDLGLSRLYTTQSTGYTTTILPTFRFIAPELIQVEEDIVRMSVTKKTDVYAFSMTALQVCASWKSIFKAAEEHRLDFGWSGREILTIQQPQSGL
jgi:serine/threonine protein kinase